MKLKDVQFKCVINDGSESLEIQKRIFERGGEWECDGQVLDGDNRISVLIFRNEELSALYCSDTLLEFNEIDAPFMTFREVLNTLDHVEVLKKEQQWELVKFEIEDEFFSLNGEMFHWTDYQIACRTNAFSYIFDGWEYEDCSLVKFANEYKFAVNEMIGIKTPKLIRFWKKIND